MTMIDIFEDHKQAIITYGTRMGNAKTKLAMLLAKEKLSEDAVEVLLDFSHLTNDVYVECKEFTDAVVKEVDGMAAEIAMLVETLADLVEEE